jgi:hypothetical protein
MGPSRFTVLFLFLLLLLLKVKIIYFRPKSNSAHFTYIYSAQFLVTNSLLQFLWPMNARSLPAAYFLV